MKITMHIIKTMDQYRGEEQNNSIAGMKMVTETWHCAKLAQEVIRKLKSLLLCRLLPYHIKQQVKLTARIYLSCFQYEIGHSDQAALNGSLVFYWVRIFPSEHQFRPRTFTEHKTKGDLPGTDLFSKNIDRSGPSKCKTVKHLPLVSLYCAVPVICSVFSRFGGIR